MRAFAVLRLSLLLGLLTLSASPLGAQDAAVSPVEPLRGFPGMDPRLQIGPGPGEPLGWSRSATSRAALDTAASEPSLRRSVLRGAIIGASAGVVSGLLVRSACDEPCDDTVAEGMALHIGVGALVGGATGAIVHWVRNE